MGGPAVPAGGPVVPALVPAAAGVQELEVVVAQDLVVEPAEAGVRELEVDHTRQKKRVVGSSLPFLSRWFFFFSWASPGLYSTE